MTDAILGIDLGTTEVKAGLIGLDGSLLGLARAGYGLEVGHGPGWAEQDPGAWWSAVVGVVRTLQRTTVGPDGHADIVAIGVDGHGPTFVPVDERGEATRPAITFLDTRAAAEATELEVATGVRG
jgi:xylulokinase